MKDEFKGKIMNEFFGLKSKNYSLVSVNGKVNKKAKGINKNVFKTRRRNEFVDVLFNTKIMRQNMKRIQCKLLSVGSYDVCKISLSCF